MKSKILEIFNNILNIFSKIIKIIQNLFTNYHLKNLGFLSIFHSNLKYPNFNHYSILSIFKIMHKYQFKVSRNFYGITPWSLIQYFILGIFYKINQIENLLEVNVDALIGTKRCQFTKHNCSYTSSLYQSIFTRGGQV